MPAADAGPERLFLALWPDPAVRRQLAHIAAAAAGRRHTAPARLHLTLVFLGRTPDERRCCYEQALNNVTVAPLELVLDRLGHWPRAGLLWLGPSNPVPPLTALVEELTRRLKTCGFQPEDRPFRPHVTLARRFRGPPPPLARISQPVRWCSDRIVLVASRTSPAGSVYQVLRYWPGDFKLAPEPLQ